MDPLTIAGAIGVATKAFNTIKQGFAIGQDIDQMASQIGKWMSAVSDVDPSVTEVKSQIDTHEAVCAERWKETILRIKRIEHIMIGTAGTTIVLLIGLLVR